MSTKSGSSSRQEPQRVGNYYVENEIGRGSFATVYKGYRSKTHQPCAIKAVSRQKLTAKLLENLEGEISILKAITHPNIVRLEDCFKNDTHIYLVMEYCTGSDLSIYIKNRGKVATLDFEPRPSMFVDWAPKSENEGKVYWPHPTSGGIDERVTRNFLGQLAKALMFLRSQNLMHRDIKPQNLLLHPASATEVSNGQPLGIPILKVADFGFARILPAAAMAETLCGSPLYMAPEILRYEKYDAKADLWSVGAVLFEMAVGKSPFRANNHVELLKRIEKNQDRIKFPDETPPAEGASDKPLPIPVGEDIKALIRGLLKRRPADRMGFEDFFASYKVWEPPQLESSEESLSPDVVSTDSSDILASKVQELVQSIAKEKGKQADRERSMVGLQAAQPLAVDPALNPAPAPAPAIKARPLPPFAVQPSTTTKPAPAPSIPPSPVTRTPRSEPKYYVGNEAPQVAPAQPTATPPAPPLRSPTGLGISTKPRPIVTERRHSKQEPASLEEPGPITPSSAPQVPLSRPRVSEGSPLAATPPMTMTHAASTGKDDSALDAGDSVVGREYVVVEKQTVEVNALADELDRATRANTALVRRPSSRTSIVSRPVSAFKPPLQHAQSDRVKPLSYSPPFGMSTTPPFAIAPTGARHNSSSSTRASPHSGQVNIFPPQALAGRSPESALQTYSRIGTSPSSLQTGALARALTNTAIRMIGQGVNTAATALGRGTSGLSSQRTRRPDIPRTGMLNDAEEGLLRSVEDLASKAFALFELGYERLEHWHALQRRDPALGLGARTPPTANVSQMPNPYAPGSSARRKSSSSSLSANSDLLFLRQQEAAAGEAVVLYLKALTFIVKAIYNIQAHRTEHGGDDTSPEINEMVQWLRARFNECYEKAEWAKQRCAEELPFIDRLLHDKAKEISRQSAHAELSGDTASAEMGYENAIWLLSALLDDAMYEGTGARLRDEDRVSVEKIINPIRTRLETIRRKSTPPTA